MTNRSTLFLVMFMSCGSRFAISSYLQELENQPIRTDPFASFFNINDFINESDESLNEFEDRSQTSVSFFGIQEPRKQSVSKRKKTFIPFQLTDTVDTKKTYEDSKNIQPTKEVIGSRTKGLVGLVQSKYPHLIHPEFPHHHSIPVVPYPQPNIRVNQLTPIEVIAQNNSVRGMNGSQQSSVQHDTFPAKKLSKQTHNQVASSTRPGMSSDRPTISVINTRSLVNNGLIPCNTGTFGNGSKPLLLESIGGEKRCTADGLPFLRQVSSRDKKGNTPLHVAAHTGDTDALKFLLENGASINAQNDEGATALHLAAYHEKTDCVKILLEHNANLAKKDHKGLTALGLAFESPFFPAKSLKLLHEGGAHLRELPETVSRQPLSCSALFGQTAVLRALLLQRDPSVCSKQQKNRALSLALSYRQSECADLLLGQGASTEDEATNTGVRFLHKAILDNNSEVVALLMRHGANVEYHDEQAMRPLCLAAQLGHLESVAALMSDPNAINIEGRYHDKTALHFAAEEGHVEILELLLSKEASIDAQDNLGKTALHLSLATNDKRCVRPLIRKGACITTTDTQGNSPLSIACGQGLKDIIIEMVKSFIPAPRYSDALARLQARELVPLPQFSDFKQMPHSEEMTDVIADFYFGVFLGTSHAPSFLGSSQIPAFTGFFQTPVSVRFMRYILGGRHMIQTVCGYKNLLVFTILNRITELFTQIRTIPNSVHVSVESWTDPLYVDFNFIDHVEEAVNKQVENLKEYPFFLANNEEAQSTGNAEGATRKRKQNDT